MKEQLKYLSTTYKAIQIVLGMVFVISGFVKGVDPVGVSYKVTEYLQLFGFEFFVEWSLGVAVLLCAAEIFIGLLLLSGIYRKFSSLLALLFLSLFTVITFYSFVTPSAEIQECGCFGDAFQLSNRDTFFKNILLTLLATLYLRRQILDTGYIRVPSSSNKRGICIGITLYIWVISLCIPLYSVIFLPPFDFLPFNIGVNVLENQNPTYTDDSGEIRFIYRNKQSGKSQKFNINDTTWQDATQWEYVDTEVPETRRENYLSKFVVMDEASNDLSATVFDDSDYNFLIIIRNIDDLRTDDFRKIAPLYQLYKDEVLNLYLFTSSEIGEARKRLQVEGFSNTAVYNVDEVVLKSMIRHKRGVILVSNGVIKGKWNLKQNTFNNLTKEKLPALVVSGQYIVVRYTVFLFSLISVLFYLVFLKNRKQKRKEREKEKQ